MKVLSLFSLVFICCNAWAVNLIDNSSFEQGLQFWKTPPKTWIAGKNLSPTVIDKTVAFSGSQSILLQGTGTAYKRLYQGFARKPKPGTKMTVTGNIKIGDLANSWKATCYISIWNRQKNRVENIVIFSSSEKNDWQAFAKTITVPPETYLMRIFLELSSPSKITPNSGSVWFDDLKIETLPDKNWRNWTVQKRNYQIESLQPLTKQLKQYIANKPPIKVKIVKTQRGAMLNLNGKNQPFVMQEFMQSYPLDSHPVKMMKKTDCNIALTGYNVSKYYTRAGWPTSYYRNSIPIWDGKNCFNTSGIKPFLWHYLRSNPDLKIIIKLNLDVYPEWDDEHPDELARNEAGYGILAINHYGKMEFDKKNNDDKRLRLAWSFHSKVLQQDLCEVARRFVQEVDAVIPGKNVIGYLISGGVDNQLYGWQNHLTNRIGHPELWPGYGKAEVNAFRAWLQKKYINIKNLNNGWGTNYLSFNEINPPAAKRLAFHNEPYFSNKKQDRPLIDFRTCNIESRAVLISKIAATIRKASKRPTLIGAWAGPISGARMDTSVTTLLQADKNIDFLASQATYGTHIRNIPATGGVNACLASYTVNNKLFLTDIDYPSWRNYKQRTPAHGGTVNSDITKLSIQWRREYGRLWSQGAGIDLHALWCPWEYDDPDIIHEIKLLNDFGRKYSGAWIDNSKNEIAIIFDEKVMPYLTRPNLKRLWGDALAEELNISGVPYRRYYTDDFRRGLVPDSKVYIFINPMIFDDSFRHQIEKIKNTNHTIVFMQGAGYFSGLKKLKSVTGLNLIPLNAVKDLNSAKLTSAPQYPLNKKLNRTHKKVKYPLYDRTKRTIWRNIHDYGTNRIACSNAGYLLHPFGAGALKVVDKNAVTLAYYSNSNTVGFAMREYKNWRTVFIGAYLINRQLIANLAAYCGAWEITEPGYVVAANENMLSIHAFKDGPVEVRLMAAGILIELPAESNKNKKMVPTARQRTHIINMQLGQTKLFRVIYGIK